MEKNTTHVGLDAHQDTIMVGFLEPGSEVAGTWQIKHTEKDVQKMVTKIVKEAPGPVEFCYEAGPCGYALQRNIQKLKARCIVVAPSLIPVKAGDRVKTDRRDAKKLALYLRKGLLTEVHPPTEKEEAVRDLCRCLEDAKEDRKRHLQRMDKMLLRLGYKVLGQRTTSAKYRARLKTLTFDDANHQKVFDVYLRDIEHSDEVIVELTAALEKASQEKPYAEPVARLRCLRGVDTLTAMTIVAELFRFERFTSPRQLMAYLGLTVSERTSADQVVRGGITKTGNSHVRRVLVEAAWHYLHKPRPSTAIRKRREGQPGWVVAIAEKAASRLHRRFHHLCNRNLRRSKAAVAVARELAGFVWATLQKHAPETAKA